MIEPSELQHGIPERGMLAVDGRLHHPDLANHPILSQVEVVDIREDGRIDCRVQSDLIDNEEVAVYQPAVESLARNMARLARKAGGTGQVMPISLGLIEGESTLKIADGYHRSAALHLNESPYIISTIGLTDWEELYDFRIFTAKGHEEVVFSRVVQWMHEVWKFSGLADKMTVSQAVILYQFGLDGARLSLESGDVEMSNAWVANKSELWELAPMTMYNYLAIAERVDPTLVRSARQKRRSLSLDAPTQTILKVLAKNIPGQFDLQRLIVQTAMAYNLQAPQVRSLSLALQDAPDVESAKTFIDDVDFKNWQPQYAPKKETSLRAAYDPRKKGALALKTAIDNITNVRRRLDLIIDRKEKVSPAELERLKELQAMIPGFNVEVGKLTLRLTEMIAKASDSQNPGKAPVSRVTIAERRALRGERGPQTPALSLVAGTEVVSDNTDNSVTAGETEEQTPVVPEPEEAAKPESNNAPQQEQLTANPLRARRTIAPYARKPPEKTTNNDKPIKETKPRRTPTALASDPSSASEALRDEITEFLNGESDTLPNIGSMKDVRAVEHLLRGSFSGDLTRLDDVREKIDSARKSIQNRDS